MKKLFTLIMLLFATISMFSCSFEQENNDIYVTVYPMQYIVEEIFENTEYTVGIVPGVTSHESSVDWSPKEIIAMTEAELLFYVGANYDYYIDAQITSIFTDKQVELVKVQDETDYIQFIQGEFHIHEEDNDTDMIDSHSLGIDPHFWISPLRVKQTANLIYDKIIEKFDDPEGIMESNYIDLCERLQDLSDSFLEIISAAEKLALTSTNIYGYLREDYGFEYLSISPGYHEETEQFTNQEKEKIVNHALEDNIRYVIYEMYTSSPLSNAIFTELENLELNPIKLEFNILQSLTDDDIANGDDYISVMYNNLSKLQLALGSQIE